MSPQRCPPFKSQNLCLYYLTWQMDVADVGQANDVEMSGAAQGNHVVIREGGKQESHRRYDDRSRGQSGVKLPLKMEGATSQGVLTAGRCWKGQGEDSPQGPLVGTAHISSGPHSRLVTSRTIR